MRRSAAILYPGELGSAVGRSLTDHGWTVVTFLGERGPRTRASAEASGIESRDSLAAAVASADLVISLVPPSAVMANAEAVAAVASSDDRQLVYLEANSVSPATKVRIGAVVEAASFDCVDGAFVGSAAELGGRTRLYLSGPRADELAAAMPAAFRATVCGPVIGAASALKLAFASFNKGLVALFLEVMSAGAAAGRPDDLLSCLRTFYPGTIKTLERLLPSYPRHAGRRADELGELAQWLASYGRDPVVVAAARNVLARLGARELDAERSWTFAEVLAAWINEGNPSRREVEE